jgi:signal peptidase II
MFKKNKFLLVIISIVLIDQISKMLIIHFFKINEEFVIIGIFKIHYVLNDGFVMNTSLDVEKGKLLTTIGRILLVSVAFLCYWYEVRIKYRKEFSLPFLVTLAGAAGNIIDNSFYGLWFGLSSPDAPMLFLHGQVVDMLHIDIWQGEVAQLGGRYFTIFPIFNIADLAMFIGFGFVVYYSLKFGKNYKTSQL